MTDSFFQAGPASKAYEAVRDADHLAYVKVFIEQIWSTYAPHADRGFLEDARSHFHQRTWEMYVWYVFEQNNFSPHKISSSGPEFYIKIGSHKFWIEAIAPAAGQTDDAVTPLVNNRMEIVPEQRILLRYTQALQEKLKAYMKNRQKGIIGGEDGYIITINGWEATSYRPDLNFPLAIKAAIGIGDLVVSVDTTQQAPSRWYHQTRTHVFKKSGSPVATTSFLSSEYKGVSALIFSDTDIVNVREPLGSEMYYFHNPTSKTPLPKGAFKFCREYWFDVDESVLRRKNWPEGT